MNKRNNMFYIPLYLLLIMGSLLFLFPIIIMILDSVKSVADFNKNPAPILPSSINFQNFVDTFLKAGVTPREFTFGETIIKIELPSLVNGFLNTLFVLIMSTIGMVFTSTLCAFGFSKMKFPGRDIVFNVMLSTVMIPGSILMIPMYITYTKLGFINTTIPLWLGMWFGGGVFNVFLTRQFMKGISNELIESSKIDGASWFRSYWNIVLPNCKAIIIVIVIQNFLGVWNDIMGPVIYINSKSYFTLAQTVANMGMGLGSIGGKNANNLLMSACVMMSVFPIVIFFIGQNYIVDNMVLSGIKG